MNLLLNSIRPKRAKYFGACLQLGKVPSNISVEPYPLHSSAVGQTLCLSGYRSFQSPNTGFLPPKSLGFLPPEGLEPLPLGSPRLLPKFQLGCPRRFHWSRQLLEDKKLDEKSNVPAIPPQNLPKRGDRLWRRQKREELLASASGFFERLQIRFKWALIRQVRPFNTDDISAFFSWILVGHIAWIILGTTTFVSLLVFAIRTFNAEEYFARKVGDFLTKETGLTVVFEHAIVPKWNDGVISLQQVFVSRRPGTNKGDNGNFKQGSQAVAAAQARANEGLYHGAIEEEQQDDGQGDDGNYTQFDLTMDTVSVTLSLRRWLDGKGILENVEVKGVRGVVDRRHVRWLPDYDPVQHRNVYKPGDFELERFKMEDAVVKLYQPRSTEPIEVCIFNCDLPQLRKHWLLYDIMSADNMSGSYDNSLFTIHPRRAASFVNDEKSPWKKISRFRVDNVDIKHLNSGVHGPFGWIQSGSVDMMADVMLPNDADQMNFSEALQDIIERWEANLSIKARSKGSVNGQIVTSVEEKAREREQHNYIVFDMRFQLNNARATVPLITEDLTYTNNALIRPIVAYINSRETYIPINCRVVKRLADFEGSWTIYDSTLMDDVSSEVYAAFARNVADDEERSRRMRKVGFWSLQFAAQLLLLGLGVVA